MDVVIEVLIADEVEEDMADDDATDDVILAKGAEKKLARKDRARHVRTKNFFSELRSLNLSSRRRHVHAEAETLSVGAVPSLSLLLFSAHTVPAIRGRVHLQAAAFP